MMEREYRPTPGELQDWRTLRYRALADAGDNAPMLRVTYRGDYRAGRQRIEQVIPWLEAVNMEVG